MRRSLTYGLYGAVLAGLVGAPVVWSGVDKTVDLVVDGRGSTVTTTASDVSQVLDAHGYRLTAHDIVAPSARSPLHDGMKVVLRRGRLLHLSIDGRERDVWTTAPTVEQALHQLGYTTSDFVSVSRSRRLPLSPSDLTIRTPQAVTVVHDGVTQHVDTTDATVGALLHDIGVTVGPRDRLSVSPSSALVAGEVVSISRVGEKTLTRTRTVGYGTKRQADPNLASGRTKVLQDGRTGTQRVTYSVIYVDGKEVARTVLSAVTTRAPRDQVVAVGTAPTTSQDNLPTMGPPTPASNKALAQELLAKRGWGDAASWSCLEQMWTRESGWRTDAANPSGAYGIPQALPGSKMAAAGADWQTNPATQITWGLDYIAERYGTPCDAWSYWQAHGNY